MTPAAPGAVRPADTDGSPGLVWHARDPAELALAHGVDPGHGLLAADVASRVLKHGPNELLVRARPGALALLAEQFKDFMVLVLLAAAVISGVIGDLTDTLVILVIVVLNAVVGFVQSWRADKAMAALQQMAAARAMVLREGQLHQEDRTTPLQRRLAAFGKRLAIGVIGICAVIFVVGILRGEAPLLMALTAISLAVAAIPEALPAVAVLLTFALQMALIYVPALNPIFKTEPLTLPELGICIGAALVVGLAVELEKAWRRRRSGQPAVAADDPA